MWEVDVRSIIKLGLSQGHWDTTISVIGHYIRVSCAASWVTSGYKSSTAAKAVLRTSMMKVDYHGCVMSVGSNYSEAEFCP